MRFFWYLSHLLLKAVLKFSFVLEFLILPNPICSHPTGFTSSFTAACGTALHNISLLFD